MRLPKPYPTSEIQKKPWAVIISLLIGLLLITAGGWITEGRIAKRDLKECNDKAAAESHDRLRLYEELLFLRRENNQLKSDQQETDSSFRARTAPSVNKLLRRS